MGDDSAEILFRSFLQEDLVSSSGIGRDVHPLMLLSASNLSYSRRTKRKCASRAKLELDRGMNCL